LAAFLTVQGHEIVLLIGQLAIYRGERQAGSVQTFSTSEDLRERLRSLGGESVGAVFHAAAVSDFAFGRIWVRSEQGELTEVRSGKISTRQGNLLAELVPTPKIISELRQIFPRSLLVGWKYEVDGDHAGAIAQATNQISQSEMDACVANGPAYGPGFGLVERSGCAHLAGRDELFASLNKLIRNRERIG
jgi:phosphopantothenoylcysteine decarboxylase/phosphopantothenate--cysteine ligase